MQPIALPSLQRQRYAAARIQQGCFFDPIKGRCPHPPAIECGALEPEVDVRTAELKEKRAAKRKEAKE